MDRKIKFDLIQYEDLSEENKSNFLALAKLANKLSFPIILRDNIVIDISEV